MHSWPICLSVVIIICLPQKEKPHALTAVFVSYLNNVVAVSQSQNLKLLSADPEMKCFVSPEDRMSQVKEVQPCLSQGPEEMCLSLEHQNPSKTSEKMGYFDRITVSLHIL